MNNKTLELQKRLEFHPSSKTFLANYDQGLSWSIVGEIIVKSPYRNYPLTIIIIIIIIIGITANLIISILIIIIITIIIIKTRTSIDPRKEYLKKDDWVCEASENNAITDSNTSY